MKSDAKKPGLHEDAEPTTGKAPVPMWLSGLLAVAVYWGCGYAADFGGEYNPLVYRPYQSLAEVTEANPKSGGVDLAVGGRIYGAYCMGCHQPNGAGAPNVAPPLAASEWVLASKPDRMVRIVLHGLQGPIEVKGTEWNLAMLAWKDSLNDQQVADVLTYVRNSWGNKAAPVTAEQVKAIRDAEQDRGPAWTAPELLKIPVE